MLLNTAVKSVKRYSHRGDQDITTDQITIDIVAALMDARRDIISRLPKRWLLITGASISTVDGTAIYSLASNVQEPVVFHYTTSGADYILKKIDSEKEWYNTIYNTTSSRNRPTYYIDRGINQSTGYCQIEMFPVPNAAYTIYYDYYKQPAADYTVSDLNSEIPDIPTHLQDAVWKGGLYYFYKAFDDPAQQQAQQDYGIALNKIDTADEDDQDSYIRFRWGYDNKEPVGPATGIRIF